MSNAKFIKDEKLERRCDYLCNQMYKYEKLSKWFSSKHFGKLGKYFEQRYEMFSGMFNEFITEHEDYFWDSILH